MSTVIVAIIFISVIFLLVFLFVFISKQKEKKQLTNLLHRFSTLGTENNLSFSSQEILRSKVIGVDGVQRKILVLEHAESNGYNWYFIDLNDIKSCRVKTKYTTPPVPTVAAKQLSPTVEFVGLEFLHKQSGHIISLPFYKHLGNSVYEFKELQAKAKDWEAMLSKMLISQ